MRSAALAVRLPVRVCSIYSLSLLDGEFDVLHVAVMLFEQAIDARQLVVSLRHLSSIDGLRGAWMLARGFGDVLRRADAGDDVFALRVDQEFAVEGAFRRWRDCA